VRAIKIVAISILLILVACGITLHVLKERRENALINPGIYPAFRRIEIYALVYVNQKTVNIDEYNRCKAVVDHMRKYPPHVGESAEEYYVFLNRLGFKLPPFKLKNPPTKNQRKKCMMEHVRLGDLQDKVIEGLYDKTVKEIEKIIEETRPEKIE